MAKKESRTQKKHTQNEIRTNEKHLNMNWETKCSVSEKYEQSVCCWHTMYRIDEQDTIAVVTSHPICQ